MDANILDAYNAFAHKMWIENCDERDSYHEPKITKEEYIKNNHTFIEDKFCTENHLYGFIKYSKAQQRKWFDEVPINEKRTG